MTIPKKTGFFLGPALFVLILLTPPQWNLSPEAWKVAAMAVLMLVWWITEATPIPVTALLPLICLPMLGIGEVKTVAASYGDPIVFLFLGGFMLALAMEKWNLHRRIALTIVKITGANADGIILGFMISTALMSMWISNTATTIMMLPIALSVISLLSETLGSPHSAVLSQQSAVGGANPKGVHNFSKTIMLGIAYAASLGGMATLIGTPPNVVFKGYIQKTYGFEVGFFDWMLVGTPLAWLLVLLTYFVNVKLLFPNRLGEFAGAKELIKQELAALGKPSKAEKRIFWLFMATVFLWTFRALLNEWLPGLKLTDEIIAMTAAIALFLIPVDFEKGVHLLDWESTRDLPWGILLLFGGGLALADGLSKTGIIDLLGESFNGLKINHFLFTLALVAATVLLSEAMSNVALVVVFLPVISGLAKGMGIDPLQLAIPVTLAASCGFMLPMATPPNAIVFGGGHLRVFDMVKAGVWLDILSIVLISLFAETVMRWIF
jgi:sodium-dependent dicarboxylate transporter 2/3/5